MLKTVADEIDAQYGELFFHCEVRWLSRGRALKRFNNVRCAIVEYFEQRDETVPEHK
nr:unnamed protein product [Callosobruchus chinensis]